MRPRLITIAGAESTGKSTLAVALADRLGGIRVDEYARAYCAAHGNDLDAEQLLQIAQQQDRLIREALATAPADRAWVVADTDAIVTAVWAGQPDEEVDPWYDDGPLTADLYLVTANDLPWQDDGVRIQRDQPARDGFRSALITELERRGLAWLPVAGEGEARLASAIAAVSTLLSTATDAHRDR